MNPFFLTGVLMLTAAVALIFGQMGGNSKLERTNRNIGMLCVIIGTPLLVVGIMML